MPWRGALRPLGYAPLVNSGMVLSQFFTFASVIACGTLRPTRYFRNVMLMSAQSTASDEVRNRLSKLVFSAACIWIVKSRSLLPGRAVAGIAVTGDPTWRSTTSLKLRARIVGSRRWRRRRSSRQSEQPRISADRSVWARSDSGIGSGARALLLILF
jgi:hypothetical protein